MQPKISISTLLLLILLAGLLRPADSVFAAYRQPAQPALQSTEVTAYDLIIAMNTLRTSNGLPALIEDPIVNAVAQATAQIMADNQSSWHIGDVAGRIQAAGYGGGAKVFATENFAVGYQMSIDQIMLAWADEMHMIPAVRPNYCHVGAGIAKSSNGMTYFVLQAAYASGKSCSASTSPGGPTNPPGGSTGTGGSGIIVPVKIATPDAEGKIFHIVEAGQSFWSIAVAYKITIADLETWNNIKRESGLRMGQKLFIPSANTAGYATPTPRGMIQVAAPDADGKIIHVVSAYNTLSTISEAYKVDVGTILRLNGLQEDWPLQIGQKLLIYPGNVTPTPTEPPLTPLQRLTPDADGRYYHIVQSGETIFWIASQYEISMTDLMNWNGLNENSLLQLDQKLLLLVTPPATATVTPGPPTATPSATPTVPTPTPSQTASLSPTAITSATVVSDASAAAPQGPQTIWFILGGLGAAGLFLVIMFARRRQ